MATNPNIALSYRPNVALERRDPLADAANVQSLQANQSKMEDLREFKEFTTRLAAAGKNPDPLVLVGEMRASGRPELVMKALELETNIKALGLEEQAYKALIKGSAPAGPSIPQAAPAAAPGSFAADVAARRGAGVNALAPTPAASTNALTPAPAMEPQAQEINRLMGVATQFPNTKAGAQAMKNAELLQKMQPSTPAEVQSMRALGIPLTPAGYQQYRDAQRQDRLLTPQELQQKLQIAAAGRAPGVSITNLGERAESAEFGKLLIGQFDAISKQAAVAARTLPSIEANLTTLNKGLDTGFGTDAKAAGARVLGALGVKDAEKFATDTQTFQSNAISAVLQKQLEQKGPQTESDARRIEQIGAELGKTKDANRFILDVAREQLRRDLDQRNFYTEWKKGPGKGSFNGAEDAWFAGEGGKSLFDRPALKKYAVGAASPAAQIPTAATPARAAPAAAPIYARNPQTNQRIMSTDGGNTWTPAR
jgi:hypothetical protein